MKKLLQNKVLYFVSPILFVLQLLLPTFFFGKVSLMHFLNMFNGKWENEPLKGLQIMIFILFLVCILFIIMSIASFFLRNSEAMYSKILNITILIMNITGLFVYGGVLCIFISVALLLSIGCAGSGC